MAYLTCGARWCTPCPNEWKEGVTCRKSDEILGQAEQYSREAQIALDVYDIMFPEDYLSALPSEGEGGAEV